LVATDDAWEPYRLLDADNSVVGEVATFLRDLLAAGKSASTFVPMAWICCGGGGF
jgi:hypothetical protein